MVPSFAQASYVFQRKCWAMWTAFIYLMVHVLCFGNTSSLNFFLSQEREGVNDIGHWARTKEGLMAKTSGGAKEN